MAGNKIPALNPDKTITFLLENREELERKFHLFFPDLIEYVKTEILAEAKNQKSI